MAATSIFLDLTNKSIVQNSKGSAKVSQLADAYHTDKLYWKIQALEIDPNGAQTSAQFQNVDTSGASLTLLIVLKQDGSTLVGPVTSWTPDGTARTGSVDFNTTPIATAFAGAATSIPAIAQIQFDDGSNRKTIIEVPITIKRSYITGSTPTALPLTSFYTRAEIDALCVKFRGNPNGASIELPSPSGSYKNVLFTDDTDGTFKADPES